MSCNPRLAARGALILSLALFRVPTSVAVEGSPVVVRVLGADSRALASVSVVARCPGGAAWRARSDEEGFAVFADVPRCPLSVEPVPGAPGIRIEVERLEARAVAVLGEGLARDLPSSRTAWSALETAEPAAILDRIDGAGLHLGEPGRFSMRGASWTQNAVLLDGVDLTDPLRGGTPLADPDVDVLERVETISGLAPVEQPDPGVALALVPRAPATSWQGTLRADGVTAGLQAGEPVDEAPSIARFGSLADVRGSVSGPLSSRVHALFSGRFGRVRRFERDDTTALEASLVSGGVHFAYTPSDRDTLRLLASAQAVRRPFAGRAAFLSPAPRERADSLGAQLRWTRVGERATLSTLGAVWSTLFEPQTLGRGAGRPVERLRDGPVSELVFPSRSHGSIWRIGTDLMVGASPLGGLWHAPRVGMLARRESAIDRAGHAGSVLETVDSLPARDWDYAWPGPDSRRHVRDVAAWVADRIGFRDRLLLEAGFRLDSSAGSADGAAEGISWTALSPRFSARFRLTDSGRVTVFGGYGQYRHRLLLSLLAFGDPNAPTAAVYRWNDANSNGRFDPAERGVLVARAGPGAADSTLAAIDTGLRPPRTREFAAGLELSPGLGWHVRLTGFDRRERDLVESVNVGVPLSGYTVRYLPDPAGDIVGAQDDQQLPVYDRKPETFGLDRYLLTNPPGHTGLHQGVELRVEKAVGARFFLLGGATASRTEIAGANRGFRVIEDDQGLVGELHDDPNADTHARGRGFFDRAYTIKVAAAYRAPGDWRLGAVARYQDGQPFGRLVVVPDLTQGVEAVPATPRGQIGRSGAVDEAGRYTVPSGHRFTYTLTVDARVEKGLQFGVRRLAFAAEAFNLLGTGNEVEEDPVSGPQFRTPTAVQPPRAVQLGLRLDF